MTNELPISDTTFVVVDVETTGMSPIDDRITEIAMMKVKGGVLTDEFSTLVNPLMSIPNYVTELTGIDNLMVREAPTAREVVPYMAEFLDEAVFVAHNVGFDWSFVYHTARRERGLSLSNPRLCTAKLSRTILPYLPSKSLGPVTRFLDINIRQRHRASGDAFATALVLVKYLSYLQKRYAIQTLGELLRYNEVIEKAENPQG
jgi:DNA polymerase-3 subunit epsilon